MSAPGSPLLPVLEAAGGVAAAYHGRTIIRHFGDPAEEYEAALEGAALFDRSHRARLAVSGRAPRRMLDGVLTGAIPSPPVEMPTGARAGRSTYHTVLTPKGKMITDLWASLPKDEEEEGFLLDVPVAGHAPLTGSFTKLLPPRLARFEDVSDRVAMLTVAGPSAASLVARLALADMLTPEELGALEEGEWRSSGSTDGDPMVIRSGDVEPVAFSVVGDTERLTGLWTALRDGGAVPAGLGVWSTLRVEAGRPAFGTDMDEGTIPTEAGIDARAIDHTKGCYTGQEVIVRIRDRGHVNRRLTRLELGDVPAPPRGAELIAADGSGKVVGRITSAVESPRYGGVVALAYVRTDARTVTLEGREVTVPEAPLG